MLETLPYVVPVEVEAATHRLSGRLSMVAAAMSELAEAARALEQARQDAADSLTLVRLAEHRVEEAQRAALRGWEGQ